MAEKESNHMQPGVPKFHGHYSHWAMLMGNLLRSKEYWNLVENGVEELPASATTEQTKKRDENKLKDLKTKSYLFQAIVRSILETILNKNTSKEIWDSMKKKEYEGSSKVRKAQLQAARKELEILEMKEGESIDGYFARTLAIVNRMKMYREQVKQETVVGKIMRSLTPKYNYVTCSIDQANDVSTLSIDELQSTLMVEEQKMKGQVKGQKEEEQVLKVTNGGRGMNRGRGRANARGGRGRGRQSWNKETIECYNCRKLGHYQSECPNLEVSMNFTEFEQGEEILLVAESDDQESHTSLLKEFEQGREMLMMAQLEELKDTEAK